MSDSQAVIELEHIQKFFNPHTIDAVTVFEDFNFTVEKGQFISIVGSNGSGKTTMLNLICGSLKPEAGIVRFKGKDITTFSEYVRASKIGRVHQDPKMGTCSQLTIMENMALADNKNRTYGLTAGVNRRRADAYRTMLEECGLGLENRMGALVGTLSGGQRQALSLVLATMTPIELLILDEHTAALDPKTADIIMQLTDKIVKEKELTALMVTHNLRYAVDYGNRLVMMHQGKAVIDKAGADKGTVSIQDILGIFNEISIECGN